MSVLEQRVQKLRIKELYNLQSVSIHVGPNNRQFSVPRSLICDLSDYFRAAFEGKYLEGTTGIITLPKVDEWTFECFVIWLYTRSLSTAPWINAGNEGPTFPDTVHKDKSEGTSTSTSTSTTSRNWFWSFLIEMYIFADQYDTKNLRFDITEAMLYKAGMCDWPDTEQFIHALNNIPDSSPVHELLLDILVNADWPNDFKELAAELPVSVTLELCSRLKIFERTHWEGFKKCTACEEGWARCDAHPVPEYFNRGRNCKYYEPDTEEEQEHAADLEFKQVTEGL